MKKITFLGYGKDETRLIYELEKRDCIVKRFNQKISSKDYDKSFKIFKARVLEMSKSIKEAISIETFLDVRHLGGAAAIIVADDNWFKGRRHANQAFQVYELWKNENQSPSFLSFHNSKNEEQFIVLSGPHRPRYLKSNKN